jgi:predicted phosphodiesterase
MNQPSSAKTRVAALYDIHGNLPALDAVLAEVRREDVDQVVVGGDVLPGPMPRETLRRLLDLDIRIDFIHGNGESEILSQLAGKPTSLPEQYRAMMRWVADQIDAELESALRAWPLTLNLDIRGLGNVLFCHATPRNDTEIFTRLTADERLRGVFANVDASLIVCGHTHMQFDRMVGKHRVVNAGSVGMPFGEPGADWLLLGPDVELRHTHYDLSKAAETIRATEYPQADDFAARYVLEPPSEKQMLEVYTPVELTS